MFLCVCLLLCVCFCVCVFGCVSVKWQHRHVKCYKIRRELIAKSCLILYQRKTSDGQEDQTFRYNKYLLNQRILCFVLCVVRKRNTI